MNETPRLEKTSDPEPVDRDERLGAAIEQYMAMAETGDAPDPEVFVARYPDLGDDLAAALDGLAMVRGLVGDSGSGPGARLEAGRRVAGYRIVRELGRGGMGIVYEAVHVDLDRPVALKVLNTHSAPDSSGRRRFLNEAKTAAGLHHTHIVPVFDVGQVGGLCYYAMQRIEGSGLDRVLKALRKGRSTAAGSGSNKNPHDTISIDLLGGTSIGDPTRSWFGASTSRPAGTPDRELDAPLFEPPRGGEYYRWVARAGVQAAEALAHAHRRGVIHRDVKPSNLLVDARGTVWVADFGLARRLADPAMTQTDSMLGTPRYMSPEQTELGPVDGRTDLYSLGTTLYELLTLRPPFDGKSAAELVGQIRDKEPAAPRKIDPKLPRDLETIIMKAMAKRPSDRYAGPTELAEDLNRFLAMEPVKARRIGPVGRAWRFARRHPSLTTVSTVAIVAILATASLSHMRVVKERNEAIHAKTETSKALAQAETAKKEMRSAMRKNLWREAVFVRQSNVPERRKTSLARIKDAVALGPDPVLTPLLRDEAVQSLGMGDIVPRDALPTGEVRRLVFTPETNRLVTLLDDGAAMDLWNPDRGEKIASHPLSASDFQEQGPPWARGAVSLLTAARGFIATIRPGGAGVRLFDPAIDTKFVDLSMPDRRVTALAATPDGKRLVVVSVPASSPGGSPGGRGGPGRPVVTLWDLEHPESEAPLATLSETSAARDPNDLTAPNRRSQQFLIACSPDSQTIALARHLDTEITLWDAHDGAKIGAVTTDAFTSSIAIAQGGELAASCGGTISRWDARTLRPLPGLNLHQPFARAIGFSPDGSMLAVSTIANSLEIWDPEANLLVASVPTGDFVHDFAFSPDGKTLVAAVKSETRVWAMVEPIGRSRLAAPDTRPASRLVQLSVSPKGVVASAFWNEKTISARVQCPEGGVSTREHQSTLIVGFDPAGRLIVLGRDYLELYTSARDDSPQMRVALPETPPDPSLFGRKLDPDAPTVQGWARAADGRALLLFRHSDVLMVRFDDKAPPTVTPIQPPDPRIGWARSSETRARPPGPENRRSPGGPGGPGGRGPGPDLRGRPGGELRSLVLSPEGDRFYTLSERGDPIDREVRGWAIHGDQAQELDLKALPREVRHMAASPDGRLLALGRFSGDVILADATTGETLATIAAPDDPLKVTALAFSRHGELAVGTRSGFVRLWSILDPTNPLPLVTLPGNKGMVSMLAYADNAQRLAVGDDSGADIWDLDSVRQQLKAIGLGW